MESNPCNETDIRFLQRNANIYMFTQTAIRFSTAKYKILKLYPNGNSLFYNKMQNFKVVPKRLSVFLKRNKKF